MSCDNVFSPAETHREDFEKAIRILREEGCREIYLFGSIALGEGSENSDLDFGIRGYPKERFFSIYGRLADELVHQADLVDFDSEVRMFKTLSTFGELRRVG